MPVIRRCRDDERDAILAIVNAAAEAYRGVIPDDRWHEPYMPADELDSEIAAGVSFWGYDDGGELLGVMGVQPVRDVTLIRHAYVAPGGQRRGVGGALLEHLLARVTTPVLIGTWAAATWAIAFYERHGFSVVAPKRTAELLETYWSIPARQVETSVVLARASDEPDLAAVEAELREHQATIHAKLEALAAAPERGSSISFGKRVGDGTTEAISRLTDVGAGEKLDQMAGRIDRALAKIEDGTYGICDSCGEPILPARLRAAPESVVCIDCARH